MNVDVDVDRVDGMFIPGIDEAGFLSLYSLISYP